MATLLQNGQILVDGELVSRDLRIEDGKISAIATKLTPAADETVYDLGGQFVAPGLIDLHVHLREPGFTNKETIQTGSAAAARGGFTTIAAMANLKPTCDTPERFAEQVARNQANGVVKIIQYAPVTIGRAGQAPVDVAALAKAGARLFSDDGSGIQDAEVVYEAMQELAAHDAIICDHAQDDSLAKNGVINAGPVADKLGLPGMNKLSESTQIARNLVLAEATGVHYHVCHVSTKESIELVRAAKAAGVHVTCEVTPHHLLLADSDIPGDDASYKMNPPLRATSDQEACLAGLLDGTIDFIATDHAPHTAEEKTHGFLGSPNGIVGSETAFALLYTRYVKTKIFTLAQLVDWLSGAPARLFHLEDGGQIKVGAPADLAVFDLDHPTTIDANQFHSKGKNSPFIGQTVYGQTTHTFVDGRLVFKEEK